MFTSIDLIEFLLNIFIVVVSAGTGLIIIGILIVALESMQNDP